MRSYLLPLLFALYLAIASVHRVSARRWRDSGTGAIVLEEAWTIPELLYQMHATPAPGQTLASLHADLLDVHNQRLAQMNANDVDFMVLSCGSPCVQGISDPWLAADLARKVNDQMAATISNNTARFGGFASLSMHNAAEAAQELHRAVTELGFLGAMVNDFQQSGPNNATLLYYDQPEYDVFWRAVSDLDVPIYFHPRVNIPQISSTLYQHSTYVKGPVQEYATTLSTHILGMCANGVFDRFPKLKIIVAHFGERLPSDLFRIDQQLERQRSNGLPMRHKFSHYWRTNLFETTAGDFATSLLKFHVEQIGLGRIMYSVDYPFNTLPEGTAWLNRLSRIMRREDLISLKRGVAIKLLKLDKS